MAENKQTPLEFHAKTVEDCWRIARNVGEHYQRLANYSHRDKRMGQAEHVMCIALRDVADNIAQCILYGEDHVPMCKTFIPTEAEREQRISHQLHKHKPRKR